ncbi:hypothetical protein M3Y96_00193500 [Aphelenchoides besseyi]|nr:hypothetical protein M3Y96_00193500 [Aphelenchoides besseyi]
MILSTFLCSNLLIAHLFFVVVLFQCAPSKQNKKTATVAKVPSSARPSSAKPAGPNSSDHPTARTGKQRPQKNLKSQPTKRTASTDQQQQQPMKQNIDDQVEDSFLDHKPVERQARRSAEIHSTPAVARNRLDYVTMPTTQTNPFSSEEF